MFLVWPGNDQKLALSAVKISGKLSLKKLKKNLMITNNQMHGNVFEGIDFVKSLFWWSVMKPCY